MTEEEKRVQAMVRIIPTIVKSILLFIAIYTGGIIAVNLMDRMKFNISSLCFGVNDKIIYSILYVGSIWISYSYISRKD